MEETKQTEIKLSDLWNVLKRCWLFMLAAFIVATVVIFAVMNATHDDVYTAKLSLYVMITPDENAEMNTTSISIATNLINDCEKLMKSHDNVLSPVMKKNNLDPAGKDYNIQSFASNFSVSRDADARILYLSFTSASALRSKEIVDDLGDQACEYFNGLYGKELMSVVDYSVQPTAPSNRISMIKILLLAFVAAILVYGVFFVRFIMDDKINGPDDVERYLGVTVLGSIPNKYAVGRRKNKYGQYYYSRRDPSQSDTEAKSN